MRRLFAVLEILATCSVAFPCNTQAQHPDFIVHNAKIVTVDRTFSICEALSVRDGRIAEVGSNNAVLATKGPRTEILDLAGKMVLPGLIDSHVHPVSACMTEFDHPLPDMNSIDDVLMYVRDRAQTLGPGKWITLRQVFITRLKEQRYPTRLELDDCAPDNPVVFATGPDASVNSMALQQSGIDNDFKVTDGGPGHVERDPKTGELSGILRGCTRYLKISDPGRQPSDADRIRRLRLLFADYNSVGITAVSDRNADDAALLYYQQLHKAAHLNVRIAVSCAVDATGTVEKAKERIRAVAANPLCQGTTMLRIIGVKTFLDGGMLTGSAYMRQPWGKSAVYSITDPTYRGVLNIPRDRLVPIVRTAIENDLQFTAHSVGDAAVHLLLDVYDEVNKSTPIRSRRPCITHANFMSKESIEKAARLGVLLDIQPAWLHLDGKTLLDQFGTERMRYFQPLASIFRAGVVAGGGSDHMQKIGSLRATNPYNPFLGIWIAVSRNARRSDVPLVAEESLSREQAIRFYTSNNAHLVFLDEQIGSLEKGKLADFVVLDRDLLLCPVDAIKSTAVERTYIAGRLVHQNR